MIATGLVAAGLAGCADDDPGPGQDALLPAAELTFPGATETYRSFREASSGRYIDGGSAEEPATLERDLTLAEPTPQANILNWYQTQLEDQGWGPPAEANSLVMRNQSDGVYHGYSVRVGPSDNKTTTSIIIQYTMSWVD